MKEKLARWLYGRYGEDAFGHFLMGCYIGIFIVNLFLESETLGWLNLCLVIYVLYRVLSRQYAKRRQENEWYLKWSRPFRLRFKALRHQMKDKNHRYYVCPSCGQICRIPKTNKKGLITCPKCYHQFTRRS